MSRPLRPVWLLNGDGASGGGGDGAAAPSPRWEVGALAGRRRLVRPGRLFPRDGELLQPTRCREELFPVDVRVACNGREVSVAEVLGDEAGVAHLLAEPRRGCVAQRVRGDVFLDPGALGGAADDVGEDRLLQASTREPAEHGVGRLGLPGVAQLPQLLGKTGR